jgi:multidrug efflux pump subunit AcrA (membrane-fusion protein)
MTKLSDSQSIPTIRTSKRKREKRYSQLILFNLVVPLLLLAVGGLIFYRLGTVAPSKRPDPDRTRLGRLKSLPPVRVVKIQSLEASGQPLRLRVDGTVVPYRESQVAAEVAGRIVFKSDQCEAGTYVTTGQLLMRIDATDHELEVQRLTQMQEQDYQALNEADQEMVNTKRLIEVASQDMRLQQREVDRQRSLPKGFASRAEIDQAQRALLAAKQQLVTSQNQLDLLKKKRVRLEASHRLAATQLKLAEINLKRTEIVAPIDGVIVNEDADLNTFVSRGSLLVTIEDTSKVEVATSLRMDQLYWVLNQDRSMSDQSIDRPPARGYDLPETPAVIEYELSGRKGVVYRWAARLMSFDGIGLDPTTRTVPVRMVVDNPNQYIDADATSIPIEGGTALVRGMFVAVNLMIRPSAPLVAIPARALQPGNRVFQFVHDETVLELDADEENGSSKSTVANETSEQAAETEAAETDTEVTRGLENFDPAKWDPGRVFVRSQIHPVDSLSIGKASGSKQENRVWVCEVRDEVLKQGSYIVVSPIGSIDDGGMPARAVLDASQIDGGPIDRDAVGDTQVSPGRRTATESTVSQGDDTAEEA